MGKVLNFLKKVAKETYKTAFPELSKVTAKLQKEDIEITAYPQGSGRASFKTNAASNREVHTHLMNLHKHIQKHGLDAHNVSIHHKNTGEVYNTSVSKHGIGAAGHSLYSGYSEDEGVPANNVGSGFVQGTGVGPQGEPGVSLKKKKLNDVLITGVPLKRK